jgi:hypothetical protein
MYLGARRFYFDIQNNQIYNNSMEKVGENTQTTSGREGRNVRMGIFVTTFSLVRIWSGALVSERFNAVTINMIRRIPKTVSPSWPACER